MVTLNIVSVQDVTYIINETKKVEEVPRVAYPLGRRGTIRLKSIDPGAIYTVLITPEGGDEIKIEYPDNFTDTIRDITAEPPEQPLTADEILAGIKTKIDDENIPDLNSSTTWSKS